MTLPSGPTGVEGVSPRVDFRFGGFFGLSSRLVVAEGEPLPLAPGHPRGGKRDRSPFPSPQSRPGRETLGQDPRPLHDRTTQ